MQRAEVVPKMAFTSGSRAGQVVDVDLDRSEKANQFHCGGCGAKITQLDRNCNCGTVALWSPVALNTFLALNSLAVH